MTLKKIHRFLLAFLILLPILFYIFYIIVTYRNNNGTLTVNSLFTSMSSFLYDNMYAHDGTVIMPTFMREFILFLGNIFTNNTFLGFSQLYNTYPIVGVPLLLLTYEIYILTFDLIFNVLRWFILFVQKLMNKGLEKI